MVVINVVNRVKITETGFDTIIPALSQPFIVKAFSIAHPVALLIKRQQGNNHHIYITGRNNIATSRFIYIEILFSKGVSISVATAYMVVFQNLKPGNKLSVRGF